MWFYRSSGRVQFPFLNFIEQIRDFWSRLSLFIFKTKLSHYCFYGVINIIIICSRFDIMSWYKLKTYMILIWMKHGDQFMINFISPIWVYIFVTVTSDVRMHSFYSETNKMTLWSLRRTHLKRSIFLFYYRFSTQYCCQADTQDCTELQSEVTKSCSTR